MGWGSGALEIHDEILSLIGKDKIRRRKARLRLLKQRKSGILSRQILWKLMNSILGKRFHTQEAEKDIEKVFMFHRRNIPDHGVVCKLSDSLEFKSANEVTFKIFMKLSTEEQKKTALWVRDGAKHRMKEAQRKDSERNNQN